MKITELIQELIKWQQSYGDLDIYNNQLDMLSSIEFYGGRRLVLLPQMIILLMKK